MTDTMDNHKKIALGLFIIVAFYASQRDGVNGAFRDIIALAVFLMPILFYRTIAYFSGFGFPEYFAKDFKSENHPGSYALFFWILYLIVCAVIIFEWSVY